MFYLIGLFGYLVSWIVGGLVLWLVGQIGWLTVRVSRLVNCLAGWLAGGWVVQLMGDLAFWSVGLLVVFCFNLFFLKKQFSNFKNSFVDILSVLQAKSLKNN